MGRRDRRAIESHLIILMQHIIKWKTQRNGRTKSWKNSIQAARQNIVRLRKISPGITDEYIAASFPACFEAARRAAETEMKQKAILPLLTWQEVFNDEYLLP
ncbi:MAG: DUF29 domain-containing protein [Candidatus Kapabacteria bacterium]|nr:DUF29 domain-containing protein [Candidatus Kapabacteria bacterium]